MAPEVLVSLESLRSYDSSLDSRSARSVQLLLEVCLKNKGSSGSRSRRPTNELIWGLTVISWRLLISVLTDLTGVEKSRSRGAILWISERRESREGLSKGAPQLGHSSRKQEENLHGF